jgi:hypothetical protein
MRHRDRSVARVTLQPRRRPTGTAARGDPVGLAAAIAISAVDGLGAGAGGVVGVVEGGTGLLGARPSRFVAA